MAAEARQSKANCEARLTQPSQGRASQAAEPNQAKGIIPEYNGILREHAWRSQRKTKSFIHIPQMALFGKAILSKKVE